MTMANNTKPTKKLRLLVQTLYVLDTRELARVPGAVGVPGWSQQPSCRGFCISNGRGQDCASRAGNCE